MPDLPPEIYIPIGTILSGVISTLFILVIKKEKDLRDTEVSKTKLLERHAENNKELAIAFLKGEGNVEVIASRVEEIHSICMELRDEKIRQQGGN